MKSIELLISFIANLAINYILFYSIFIFLNAFLIPKYKNISLYIVFISTFLYSLITQFNMTFSNFIIIVLFVVLSTCIFYLGKLLSKLFYITLYLCFTIISELIILLAGYLVFGMSRTPDSLSFITIIVLNLLNQLIVFILIQLSVILFSKTRTQITKESKSAILLLLSPIASTIALFLVIYLAFENYIDFREGLICLVIAIGLAISNVLVFYVHNKNHQRFELELEYKQLKSNIEIQTKYYEIIQKNVESDRSQIHDFKKHLLLISKLAKGNHEVTRYVKEATKSIDQEYTPERFGLDNKILNLILFETCKRCKHHNIDFKYRILYPKIGKITYVDTCTIFANAMDNAVESCLNANSSKNKNIEFIIYKNNNMICVSIVNTKANICKNLDGKIISTKNNPMHGFGLKNIKRTVQQYNGLMSIDDTGDLFKLLLIFPING